MNINVGVTLRLSALRNLLYANPSAELLFQLPDGSVVPSHYHVTEVGRVRKDFVDCGGTVRSTDRCVLQLWVADDRDHRLAAGKLARIIESAKPILGDGDYAVEVEYDLGVITQSPIRRAEATPAGIVLQLEGKHTACLAPELCCPPQRPTTGAGGTTAKCC